MLEFRYYVNYDGHAIIEKSNPGPRYKFWKVDNRTWHFITSSAHRQDLTLEEKQNYVFEKLKIYIADELRRKERDEFVPEYTVFTEKDVEKTSSIKLFRKWNNK